MSRLYFFCYVGTAPLPGKIVDIFPKPQSFKNLIPEFLLLRAQRGLYTHVAGALCFFARGVLLQILDDGTPRGRTLHLKFIPSVC
jgi:hypothetical protein